MPFETPHQRSQRRLAAITLEQCQQFARNPTVNPTTGLRINPNGDIGRRLQEICVTRYQVVVEPEAQGTVQQAPQRDVDLIAAIGVPLPDEGEAPAPNVPNAVRRRLSVAAVARAPLPAPSASAARKSSDPFVRSQVSSPLHTSSSNSSEAAVSFHCATSLSNITTPPFKAYANKLKKICTKLTNQCPGKDLQEIRAAIARSFRPEARTTLAIETPDKPFSNLINRIVRLGINADVVKVLFATDYFPYINVQFVGQAGVGEGVLRTFLQGCLDEIKETGFFVKAGEDSLRYVINGKLNVQILKAAGYNIEVESHISLIYVLIGRLFAFCARYDIPIDMPLSRGILASLLYKPTEIHPDEFVMYYLLDMPEISNSMINLMRNPDHIAALGMSFNDDFPLADTDQGDDLSVTNFRKYLQLRARHQLIHQLTPGAPDTHEHLKALVKGFYIRQRLRSLHVTIPQVDALMSGSPINLDSIREWLTPNRIVSQAVTHTEKELVKFVKSILLDEGKTFPMEIFGVSDATKEEKERKFLEFIGRLMFFWTSLRKLDTTAKYQITFSKKGDKALPESHTCFKQLVLSSDILTRKTLYRLLVTAAFNAEAGVGLYGGGGTKRKSKANHQKK